MSKSNQVNQDYLRRVENLYARYPSLYANVYCGFSCPDGWLSIVERLSDDLWTNGLIDESNQIAQVKQKFGDLCVYFDGHLSDEAIEVYREATRKARTICEFCGSEDNVHRTYSTPNSGWVVVICQYCRKDNGYTGEDEAKLTAS